MADALDRVQPAPLEVEIYDEEDGSGNLRVAAIFALEPNPTLLDVLAAAFGGSDFTVSETAQRTWSALTTLPAHALRDMLADLADYVVARIN